MAIQETRGWLWTKEEKGQVATWKSELRKQNSRIKEQVSRFSDSVPEFSHEAENASRAFLTLAEELVAFAERSGSRKYQPFSPDEVSKMLQEAQSGLEEWHAFTSRPDVREAVAQANKRIKTQRRAVKHQQQAERKEIEAVLNGKVFTDIVDGYVSDLVKAAADQVRVVRILSPGEPFGEAEDYPILQRLLLVHFVRSTYESNPAMRAEMAAFVSSSPKPTMSLVLRHAVYLLAADLLLNPSELSRMLYDRRVLDQATAHYQDTFRRVTATVEEWRKQMVTPKSLDRSYFTILGHDYSLQAQPE